MKFKLDENLGSRNVRALLEPTHDVQTVTDEAMNGADDLAIFKACVEEARCLITLDLDFADILRFPPESTKGVAILRFPGGKGSLSLLATCINNLLTALNSEEILGKLWIVEVSRVRIYERKET